ncbi:MAG: hypothetical protein KDK36_05935 [Leptospiraceae bacterium]|nr:hypothetical protein [Leptospiraceae bacterium]
MDKTNDLKNERSCFECRHLDTMIFEDDFLYSCMNPKSDVMEMDSKQINKGCNQREEIKE